MQLIGKYGENEIIAYKGKIFMFATHYGDVFFRVARWELETIIPLSQLQAAYIKMKRDAEAEAEDSRPTCVIKEGWLYAGKKGTVLGPSVKSPATDQEWTPVLWDGEDDPAWFKTAALEK